MSCSSAWPAITLPEISGAPLSMAPKRSAATSPAAAASVTADADEAAWANCEKGSVKISPISPGMCISLPMATKGNTLKIPAEAYIFGPGVNIEYKDAGTHQMEEFNFFKPAIRARGQEFWVYGAAFAERPAAQLDDDPILDVHLRCVRIKAEVTRTKRGPTSNATAAGVEGVVVQFDLEEPNPAITPGTVTAIRELSKTECIQLDNFVAKQKFGSYLVPDAVDTPPASGKAKKTKEDELALGRRRWDYFQKLSQIHDADEDDFAELFKGYCSELKSLYVENMTALCTMRAGDKRDAYIQALPRVARLLALVVSRLGELGPTKEWQEAVAANMEYLQASSVNEGDSRPTMAQLEMDGIYDGLPFVIRCHTDKYKRFAPNLAEESRKRPGSGGGAKPKSEGSAKKQRKSTSRASQLQTPQAAGAQLGEQLQELKAAHAKELKGRDDEIQELKEELRKLQSRYVQDHLKWFNAYGQLKSALISLKDICMKFSGNAQMIKHMGESAKLATIPFETDRRPFNTSAASATRSISARPEGAFALAVETCPSGPSGVMSRATAALYGR